MRRLAGILLALGSAVLMAGCSKEVSGDVKEPTIIRVAFNQSEQHPEYIAMKEFVRTGALQMAMVPVSVPEGYNSDFAILYR